MRGQLQPSDLASSKDTESLKKTNSALLSTLIVLAKEAFEVGFVAVEPVFENVMPKTPYGFPVSVFHRTTSFSATNDGPDPCRRKSHSLNAVFSSSTPLMI